MKNSKLVKLLRTFSAEEMNEMDRFLRSPYFIKGDNLRTNILLEFFNTLRSFHPGFDKPNLTKEDFYQRLYPGKEYKDDVMRNLISHLLRFTQKFLIQRRFEVDEMEKRKLLLEELIDRNQEKLFDIVFKKTESLLETSEMEIGDYFYDKYFLRRLWWDFYSSKKNVYKFEEDVKNNDYYFYYVILSSLRIYIAFLSLAKSNKSKMILFEEIMVNVSQNLERYKNIPSILIYFYMIKLFITGEEIYFSELIKLKKRHLNDLSIKDRYNLFVILTNFCHSTSNKGDEKFRYERFKLDKEFIKSEAIDYTENMHVFYFNSTVSNAAIIGEYKWAETFIEKYHGRLDEHLREFAVGYLKALILFEQKKYESALSKLATIRSDYSHQKQNIRNLMLQIYFETGSYENAISLIDTSRHFLKKDENLREDFKKGSENFIKIVSELINLKLYGNKNKIDSLKRKLLAGQYQNKAWLFKKIEELKPGKKG